MTRGQSTLRSRDVENYLLFIFCLRLLIKITSKTAMTAVTTTATTAPTIGPTTADADDWEPDVDMTLMFPAPWMWR